jgi:chromosome partitioning protein
MTGNELGWPTSGSASSATAALGWPALSDVTGNGHHVSRETLATEPGAAAMPRIDASGPVSRETPVDDGSPDVSRETSRPPRADVSRETWPGDGVAIAQDPPQVATPPTATAFANALAAGASPEVSETVSRETDSLSAAASAEALEELLLIPVPSTGPWPRPATRRVYTVANQKGGVGKTTSTVNLAAALAQHGARVLVIDLDPQGNASTAFGVEHREGTPSVYDVLVQGRPLAEVAVPAADLPGLDCVPATIDLAGAEIELVSVVARESRLRKALDALPDDYDYVFIDCPPSLGLLTVNALVAGREVLIPIQCEFYALEGLSQLLRNIELVRAHLNPELHVSTILLTMYDARTRLAEQVAAEVRNHFGDLVLGSTIPRSVRISEAPGYGQSVITYDPVSRGAHAYTEAAHELAERASQPSEGEAV